MLLPSRLRLEGLGREKWEGPLPPLCWALAIWEQRTHSPPSAPAASAPAPAHPRRGAEGRLQTLNPRSPKGPLSHPQQAQGLHVGGSGGGACGSPSPAAVPLLHCSWGQTPLLLGSSGTAEEPLPAAQEGVGLGPREDLGALLPSGHRKDRAGPALVQWVSGTRSRLARGQSRRALAGMGEEILASEGQGTGACA